MAKIVGPQIKKIYKKTMEDVIDDLHRIITVFSEPVKTDCPNCHWDAFNQSSSGVFDSSFVIPVTINGETISPQSFDRGRCPVCLGEGVLYTESSRFIKALVKWNPDSQKDLLILPAGREGVDFVRIKTYPNNFNLLKNAIGFEVDGVRCEFVKSPTMRSLGKTDGMAVAYLQAVEVGKDTRSS